MLRHGGALCQRFGDLSSWPTVPVPHHSLIWLRWLFLFPQPSEQFSLRPRVVFAAAHRGGRAWHQPAIRKERTPGSGSAEPFIAGRLVGGGAAPCRAYTLVTWGSCRYSYPDFRDADLVFQVLLRISDTRCPICICIAPCLGWCSGAVGDREIAASCWRFQNRIPGEEAVRRGRGERRTKARMQGAKSGRACCLLLLWSGDEVWGKGAPSF